MNSVERQEHIRQMLGRLRDALAASSNDVASDSHDSRTLQFGKEFNAALRELDRCLGVMRKLGDQQAIGGIPLRIIRWQVIAWYVDVHHVQRPRYKYVLKRNKGKGSKTTWVRKPAGYELEPQRHRDARQSKAELGIPWLAKEFRWDKIHLGAIKEAVGELKAA